jgi:pyruvate kinase
VKYETVATLGPASSSADTWSQMVAAGATGFRLNTSHISLDQLEEWLKGLDIFLSAWKSRPFLVLDLQGSKWRLGGFESRELYPGQRLNLRYIPFSSDKDVLPVPHRDFFQAAPVSRPEILLNDAKVHLLIEAATSETIQAVVVQGGEISANKGVTFSQSSFRKETLNDKDSRILAKTAGFASLRYAISYVKDAAEMRRYRSIVGEKAYLIAKLERQTAVEEALEIAKTADELWLCRGDLGAEMGMKRMAEVSLQLSKKIKTSPVPVLLAGQVLEHMVEKPSPTRSEICCLYDSLERGYSGFVLSDETAIGRFPVESCRNAALFKIQ